MRMQSNKKDFKGQKIFVGIDVHLKSWTVTVMTESGFHKTHTQNISVDGLIKHLRQNYPGGEYHIVYESGFTGYSTYYKFNDLGIRCDIINAADVPSMQREKLQKTDNVDSYKLARALKNGDFKDSFLFVPDRNLLDDRSVVRIRHQKVLELAKIKSRIKHCLHFNGVEIPDSLRYSASHWTTQFKTWLHTVKLIGDSIKSMDILLETYDRRHREVLDANIQLRRMCNSPRYNNNYKLLTSIPGIGQIAGMTILTEVMDFSRFSCIRKFLGYIGLKPMTKSSGEKDSVGEMTFRGNHYINSILVEASWIAIRKSVYLSSLYGRLLHQGMKPQKAIIRVARKLACFIFATIRTQKAYEEDCADEK